MKDRAPLQRPTPHSWSDAGWLHPLLQPGRTERAMMDPIVGSLSPFLWDLDSALGQHILFSGGLDLGEVIKHCGAGATFTCARKVICKVPSALHSVFTCCFVCLWKQRKEDFPVVSVGWLIYYAQDNGFGTQAQLETGSYSRGCEKNEDPTIIMIIINRELHPMCILCFACCPALKV